MPGAGTQVAPISFWKSVQSPNIVPPAWTTTKPPPLRTNSSTALRKGSGQIFTGPSAFQLLRTTSQPRSVSGGHCSGCSFTSTVKRRLAVRICFSAGVVSFQL